MSARLYTQEQIIVVRNVNYKAGRTDERERIIKLLETKPAQLMCCTCGMDQLIALIKEENK